MIARLALLPGKRGRGTGGGSSGSLRRGLWMQKVLTADARRFSVSAGRPDRPYLTQGAHPAVHGEAKGGDARPGFSFLRQGEQGMAADLWLEETEQWEQIKGTQSAPAWRRRAKLGRPRRRRRVDAAEKGGPAALGSGAAAVPTKQPRAMTSPRRTKEEAITTRRGLSAVRSTGSLRATSSRSSG